MSDIGKTIIGYDARKDAAVELWLARSTNVWMTADEKERFAEYDERKGEYIE